MGTFIPGSCTLPGIRFFCFTINIRRGGSAGMGVSREYSRFQASSRRRHFEACARQQCHVLRYSAARPLYRTGLASWRSLPEIVAQGRKPNVFACGFCHREDGPGGPENANLAGLPPAYIIQQMADYKSGARKNSVPTRGPIALKVSLSKDITDTEVQAAAIYFSALKPRSNIRVVETDTVPKTFVAGWFLTASNSGEKEPIGQRIIEVPDDLEQFENRDPRSQFIAYVPIGSIAKRCGTGQHRR